MILDKHPQRQNNKQKAIGYWSEKIKPQDYVDPNWDETERLKVINHLNNGQVAARWRGRSRCRFCDQPNGSTCLTDGTYIWPAGFAHYLQEHNVRPPLEFIKHVIPTAQMEEQRIPEGNVPDNYHAGYRCLDCRTVILSLSRHSFVTCECYNPETGKGCFVDGGFDYTRAGGDPSRMETVKIKIR